MRTLGLTTAACYGRLETEEMAALMPDMPLDCCEVFLETHSEYSVDFARRVRAALGDLPVHSVHPLGTLYENQLFSRSPRQRADAFEIFGRVLDAGQALGAKVYVFHGPFGMSPDVPRMELDRIVPTARRMIQQAGERDMVIGWENVSWAWMSRPEHTRQLREALPDLWFVLDNKQSHRLGLPVEDFIPAMAGRIVNVHVCDIDGEGKLQLAGRGQVDFPRLFQRIRETGYRGPVIHEPYSHLFESPQELVTAAGALRAALDCASQTDQNSV